MPRFLVTYHGGREPKPGEMESVRAAFGKWLAESGKAVIDPGAPVSFVAQVTNGAAADKVMIGGYSVIEAESADAALALLKRHPFVHRGGTLQLSQAMG